jgi:hypothetical protein
VTIVRARRLLKLPSRSETKPQWERIMRPLIFVFVALLPFIGMPVQAQETEKGPGRLEVTAIPGGGTFFIDTDSEPGFGSYDLGGSVTYRLAPHFSVEGEVGGTLGVTQSLQIGGFTSDMKTPNMFGYTGNLLVVGSARHALTPYATGGVGGLTVFERPALGINDTENLLTGNVGGGVKWYVNHRWGLRGDYRFIAVGSTDSAPDFFGHETRYGHRVYGGAVVNVLQ